MAVANGYGDRFKEISQRQFDAVMKVCGLFISLAVSGELSLTGVYESSGAVLGDDPLHRQSLHLEAISLPLHPKSVAETARSLFCEYRPDNNRGVGSDCFLCDSVSMPASSDMGLLAGELHQHSGSLRREM